MLRPVQLLAIALKIVEKSEYIAVDALNTQVVARQFIEAFELSELWGITIPENRLGFAAAPEMQVFAQWQAEMQQQLVEQQALSHGQLPQALIAMLAEGLLELPTQIVFTEVLEIDGATQQLFDAIGNSGLSKFTYCELNSPVGGGGDERKTIEPRQFVAENIEAEVEAAARWAAQCLQTRQAGQPPIALLLAQPDSYNQPLLNALEQHVYPLTLFPQQLAEGELLEAPWRQLGVGKLTDFAMIASARDIFALGLPEPDIEVFSRVLRSQFVHEYMEKSAIRAQIDLYLREKGKKQARLKRFLKICEQQQDFEENVAFIPELVSIFAENREKRSPSAWARFFDKLLLTAGWPQRDKDAPWVQQTLRGLSQVMDSFRCLDYQLGEIAYNEAFHWLTHILDSKRFELDREHTPAIQVMDAWDADGQHFDHCWILGLSDSALPRPVRSSPFIPKDLLDTAGIPDTDPANCMRRDQAMLRRLMAGQADLVVSYSKLNTESVAQLPCPLLPWSHEQRDGELVSAYTIQADFAADDSELDAVSPLSEVEIKQLRGGTGIFKDYSASPFIAFCRYRLKLEPFPRITEGLDAAQQGNWVHGILELFWQEVKTSTALALLSEEDLKAKLIECIEKAMLRAELDYGEALLNLERRRLLSLITAWLEFELSREDPFIVEATELASECDVHGVPLRTKLDRLDVVNGRRLIIDYKTGKIDGRSLNSDELSEPQLPIYALFGSDGSSTINGVALAQLHPKHGIDVHMRSDWTSKLEGGKNRAKKGVVESEEAWQAELIAWDNSLARSATGFLSGDICHNYLLTADDMRYSPDLLPLLGDYQPAEADGESGQQGEAE